MLSDLRNIWKKCRELSCYTLFLSNHFYYPPILGILTLFTLPALVNGCSPALVPKEQVAISDITIKQNSIAPQSKGTLDVLIFNDDALRRLDSYQRFDNWDSNNVNVASCSGKKIIIAVGNSKTGRFGWAQINSLDALNKLTASLKNEELKKPTMTGTLHTHTGNGISNNSLVVTPISSFVEIRSIRSDFTGLPYEKETITNAKAYLININSECSLTASGAIMPSRIINMGEWCENDFEEFPNSALFLHRFDNSIGKTLTKENVKLICYPNAAVEESPGSPFTKLVIEGKIGGKTYYWTLPVNRNNDNSEQGIYRNCRYIYDIDIRRKGTTKPNINIGSETITFKIETAKWEEKEEYEILY